MANATTPSDTHKDTLSSAAGTVKEGAAEAVVAAKDGFESTKEKASHITTQASDAVHEANRHVDGTPIRDQVAATVNTIREQAGKRASSFKDEAVVLKDQASAKAREAAEKSKGKAAEAVGSFARILEDTADTVDEKLGKQYGDYARSAASSVSGFADTLDGTELDEITESAREFVRKSPVVAVSAAAVAGFVLARLLRGSPKA